MKKIHELRAQQELKEAEKQLDLVEKAKSRGDLNAARLHQQAAQKHTSEAMRLLKLKDD